ncbi:related to Oxidation resistance protein 1 [Cephalotrichum gorgonifer]|uniref:Oxidation resistance protein 1 n=1 Tax=Cephalotrichum gorgonifer TaxID=2041049 RepID=A0AAE8SU58_9PEZI|nr:related to Oxidation resistance protein 1 [Cephalotrichum gorgonifer]
MPKDLDRQSTTKENLPSTGTDSDSSADANANHAGPKDESAAPPPGRPSPSPGRLRSSVTNMWSGLMRSFSSDSTGFPTQSTNHNSASTDHSSTSSSLFQLPPLDPVELRGYKASTEPSARLLTSALAEEIRTLIPERMKLVDEWDLIFSLAQDGASLGTMYSRARAYDRATRAGFVIVVRDSSGGTFGAYLSEYPHPAPSYFGNGECFLWRATTVRDNSLPSQSSLPPPPSSDTTNLTYSRSTTVSSGGGGGGGGDAHHPPTTLRFKAFPYSGLNDFFMNCEASFFSIGSGGGHYGLWIDSGLLRGYSFNCETFGNEPLSEQGESFNILSVELWAIGK